MRERLGIVLTAALLAAALPPVAGAAEAHAPPTLAPSVAQLVAAACPGTGAYADALVRGITKSEADAAAPALDRCAAQIRLPELRWKTRAAELGLAAVQLSQGLLDHDGALLKRAADATRDLSRDSRAPDADVRTWDVIPDYYDVSRREAVVLVGPQGCGADASVTNAAYINLAARTGTAWISTARTDAPSPVLASCGRVSSASFAGSYSSTAYGSGGATRDGYEPIYQPGENLPGH